MDGPTSDFRRYLFPSRAPVGLWILRKTEERMEDRMEGSFEGNEGGSAGIMVVRIFDPIILS